MSNDQGVWWIPFKGRFGSGPTDQNFLWQYGNTYIMDNHRAALWCWLRQLPQPAAVGLFHIDAHFDALANNLDSLNQYLPSLSNLSIDEYLNLQQPPDLDPVPAIRWDNYVSLFLARHPQPRSRLLFATHNIGDVPPGPPMAIDPWELPDNIGDWLSGSDCPWIVNIDLDYFFCRSGDHST